MSNLVDGRPLSGFQDILPADALAFERAVESLKGVFRRYGYAPIDTPCIYRYETLTGGEAGIDKQLFDWKKIKGTAGDQEGEHIALRFDLTVPLARYVATNFSKLTFPFKRYDVGKVWRGERPQKGRYREFYQCDFDLVGTTAPTADVEVALVMHDSLTALGADQFIIRMNDRQILNGLMQSLALELKATEILRVLDKLDKTSEAAILDEMTRAQSAEKPGLEIPEASAKALLAFVTLSAQLDDKGILAKLQEMFANNMIATQGVDRLRFVLEGAKQLRPNERFKIDLSIARGLGYYTGTVYETTLLNAPGFGSVCSGGRYDDLASCYTKEKLPGVGASVGLSRLLAAMQTTNTQAAPCPVLVVIEPSLHPIEGVKVADLLRAANIGAEVYPQGLPGSAESVKFAKQMKYGNSRGHAFAIIVAPAELTRGAVMLKNMQTQTQTEVPYHLLAETIKQALP
jgi:histidyl-tRNA synthetase